MLEAGTSTMESKLLDMRDCSDARFQTIYREILRLHLLQQPHWFRPLLLRSKRLSDWVGYDHWARAWEYPWALLASELGETPLKVLDVGGGGSPFAAYLAVLGHSASVTDPSMNLGLRSVVNKEKGLYRNLRSMVFWSFLRLAGINALWNLPPRKSKDISYYIDSATDMRFPDDSFDRVFCLSVMEHIPFEHWPRCMEEFQRVLKPGGRLVITLDMGTPKANDRIYQALVNSCGLELVGDPSYRIPISLEDKRLRHPGFTHETIGLVWRDSRSGDRSQ